MPDFMKNNRFSDKSYTHKDSVLHESLYEGKNLKYMYKMYYTYYAQKLLNWTKLHTLLDHESVMAVFL